MKKQAWSILSAVIAILLVCVAMACMSGCKKETPLEVGQVDEVNDSIRLVEWPDPPTDMSFCFNDTEVIFAWDGEKFDVIYDANDLTGAANVFFGCMKSYLNAHIEAAAERLNRKGQPGPDKCQDCVALKTILKDSIANTDRAMKAAKSLVMQIDALTGLNETQAEPNGPPQWGKGDIVAFPVPGEMPSYSIYETKTLVRTNGLNEATIELAPFPPGPWEPLGECQYCGRSFRGMTEQEMWRHGDTCPGLLDADHTGTTPVWGKGDLSAEHIKFFGESNGSRLDYIQNQTIGRHSEIIKEMAIRILILEGADPNDVRLGGAG